MFRQQLFSLSSAALALVAGAAHAGGAGPVNFVKNGSFEDSTANDISTYPSSAGGIGQIQLGSPLSPSQSLLVTLAEWTKTQVSTGTDRGFAFVINADADKKLANTTYPNQGGGFPNVFSAQGQTNIFLWGPDYSPSRESNQFDGPPGSVSGNKFIGAYGSFGVSILSQVLSGFDAAKSYILSYDYAGAQATDALGATLQKWTVKVGGLDLSTSTWNNPSKGFTAWKTYTSSPISGSLLDGQTLSFQPYGDSPVASGITTLDPVLLLDNVTIFENTQSPNPVPAPLPLLGAGAAVASARRLRRISQRLSAAAKAN